MHFLDLILKKRNAQILSKAEIDFFISNYVQGHIPDYQVSALLMAIWFSKMNERETADLTFAMRDSGETIDLSDIEGRIADKHSTGGVADTTTLITAPIVAACGLKVAKVSGRGLGHTGGTIDKLESIPGFNTNIEMERFKRIVVDSGMSIIGQTKELVPADKMLYGLRDVTGTIDSRSLISASIMSKKLASGADTIVLDIKTGNGAFMKEKSEADLLATAMVNIGKMAGKKITALVTDMNQPLGNAVGNSLEVKEAIEILQGDHRGDLREVSVRLAAQLLVASGLAQNDNAGSQMANLALESGKALKQLTAMIEAQGGDPSVCDNTKLLPEAKTRISLKATADGYIRDIKTNEVGMSALLLGAGRVKKTDVIDPGVGVWMKKRRGDYVSLGEEVGVFYVNSTKHLEEAKFRFQNSIVLSSERPHKYPLIYNAVF
jgi:pyrimidine-nucleoside phosphorylase